MGLRAGWGCLLLLASCGGAQPPAAGHVASPVAAGDATASSTPEPCLTFPDAELACERRCVNIESVVRTCAAPGAEGRMEVHFVWQGARTDVEIEIEGEHLERPAACVREAFARFVPCTGEAPMEGSVTLRFAGGWTR